MNFMRKALLSLLLIALVVPVWTAAGAQTLTTEEKFQALKEKGIFTGVGDGSSRLNDPMTREQFAAVLSRLWGLEEEKPTRPTFADVLKTRWSYSSIEAVSKAGLMQGIGNGKFAPLAQVTVEQLAAVFVRAYGYEGPGATPVRGKASLWARGAVSIALDHGFIPERSDYTANATRALLVEAAYAAEQGTNVKKLSVDSVQPLSNSTIQVKLNQAVERAEVSRFSLVNEQGGSIAVLRTDLSSDGKTVTVYTGPQSPYIIHTLYVDGEGWRYTSLQDSSSGGGSDNGDNTRPRVASVTATGDRTLKIVFSESVTRSSATDPDNYEITRGDLDLRSFELDDDRKTVWISTSDQEDGYTYRLTVRGVRDLSGNVMTSRTDLTFTGNDDESRPTVKSVTNNGNNSIKVVFSEKVDSGDARDTDNYRLDNDLYVTKATLAGDGLTVTLYTNEQKNGQTYRLTIRDIADLSGNVMDTRTFEFKGLNDHDKPTVRSVTVLANSTVKVQFSEKVNESQATTKSNYSIDNGLSVLNAVLNDEGDAVILTTSKQKDGVLYNLTVKGISDLAGNVMEKQTDLYFGGLVDNTPPEVTSIKAGTKQVVLTFSERLDSASATRASNYKLDGGLGTPKSVKYDDAKRAVTLETAAQTPGAVYTVTINQVKDLSGLTIKTDTRLQFVGVDSGTGASIAVQSIAVVDKNTVQITFSRALYDANVAGLKLAVVKDNGSDMSNEGWQSYVSRKPDTDNVALVQFRTEKNANPSLFQPGHAYVGEVTGIDGLRTDDGANRKPFAGTEKANPAPYASKVAAVNDRAVKVTFSEPVKGVSKDGFRILDHEGEPLKILSDSVGDPNRVVFEATLYLDDALRSGRTYKMQFRDSVTDAAGWNAIRATDDSKPYEVPFAGTSSGNAAPRIDKVTSPDRYTFVIQFTEPVRIGDTKGFSLYNETNGEEIDIGEDGYALYVPSADRTTLTVYLNSTKDQRLQSGKRYLLEFDSRHGDITDDQGEPLRGSSDPIEATFTSSGSENARPSVAKVEARGTLILVTFGEAIRGYTNQTNLFDIEVGGQSVKPSSGSLQGPNAIALKVPALTSGQIGKLRINSEGEKAIRDLNQQAPATDEVSFGVQ